jgi:hypothetical protein
MSINDNDKKNLNKIKWFLIIMGMLELFVIILLSKSIIGLIIGLSTIIPAYIALDENRYKWSYGMGIWGIIKYSPITWIGLLGFIFGDLHSARENGIELTQNLHYVLIVGFEFLLVILVIISFIFSIVILRLTSRQLKMNKNLSKE